MVGLFLVFTCIRQEDVAKIHIPEAPRNVNPARAITWLVGATIYCTYHFSVTTHLHLASRYARKCF